MIKFTDVSYSYGTDKSKNDALKSLSFEINNGELISILGKSGSGKSTLVKLLFGTLTPKSGNIEYNFHFISYMPQDGNLLPYLTIRKNIELHCRVTGREYDNSYIEEYSNLLGITQHLDKYPKELSGGQRQRASLLNALAIKDCDCLILDESFSALDQVTRVSMQNLLLNLHNKNSNLTIILITHDVDEALIVSDKVMLLNEGSIVQFGTPTELINNPTSKITSDFINNSENGCSIRYNSWRVSAIRRAESMRSEFIDILDEDDVVIGTVRVSDIRDSLVKNPLNSYTLLDVIKDY